LLIGWGGGGGAVLLVVVVVIWDRLDWLVGASEARAVVD
jgi:hypothetical protein